FGFLPRTKHHDRVVSGRMERSSGAQALRHSKPAPSAHPLHGPHAGSLHAGLGVARRASASNGLQRTTLRLLGRPTVQSPRANRSRLMCAERSYDAIIVGSGIAGALIAKQLGLAGRSVLILEAGAELPSDSSAYMQRFYNAYFKVPEIPYTPDLFD